MKKLLLLIISLISLASALTSEAQDFSVSSFKLLPNDISAFINPVKDLNDEDCALIKIIAPEEFAFSSPLGIVRRIDKTGEIWLYIPRRSKKITFKHPSLGVLRDYQFPEKIESHLTYEIRLDIPPESTASADSRNAAQHIGRDTLILTKTDTIMLDSPKKKTPFTMSASLTLSFGGNSNTILGGIMLTAMRAHGGFLKVSSDFRKSHKTIGSCSKDGAIDGAFPFYSGKTGNCAFQITAGGIHRISPRFNLFEGIGYGINNHYWQLADSEGGGMVKNSHYSYSGVLIEVGGMASLNRVVISVSVSTLEGKQWFGCVGAGIKF